MKMEKALRELTTKHGVILEDTPTDYFKEYMAAAKKTLNKNAADNKFFAKVYKSMKDLLILLYHSGVVLKCQTLS